MTPKSSATGTRSPATFRPVQTPVPITVEAGLDQQPRAVVWRGKRKLVSAVLDCWRIDEEWWRAPVRRLYHRVVLGDEQVLTIFEDLCTGRWYMQRYRYGRAGQAVDQGTAPRPTRGRRQRAPR
jgi:hypothetical protein